MKVPFINLGLHYKKYKKNILREFDKISRRGDFILGSELKKFEFEFAKYCGTKYSVGVGNGSDALTFSLLALNIRRGDEVILPVNSFIASAWTIANVGATPVFVDVKNDLNLDPIKIEKVITKKTKAIMPVHLTGRIADMENIILIAKKYKLKIIEDAAQAAGSELNNKKAGSFGITGCFSLHPLKNLHVHGDGGVITTSNLDIYKYFLKIRNHGLKNRDQCEFWGYNSRLDNIQAAIARFKLKNLDKINKKFRNIAKIYTKELDNFVIVPREENNRSSIFHRYIIQHPKRNQLQKYLFKRGIETKINYPIPLHLQKASKYLGYKKNDFPIAEKLSKTILSLPIYDELKINQVEYVIKTIKNF